MRENASLELVSAQQTAQFRGRRLQDQSILTINHVKPDTGGPGVSGRTAVVAALPPSDLVQGECGLEVALRQRQQAGVH